MNSRDWDALHIVPEQVHSEFDSLPEEWKLRVENAVLKTFKPETDHRAKVLTTVTALYLNEIGGEPKLCRDGSKIIQPLPRTYLNRAMAKASILLDLTVNRIEQICIYERCDGTDKRSVFIEDLTDINYQLITYIN
ncbi:hypothetical protein [Haloarchaeobius sp. TZWSO28]|uniref:hypothetical protein n=1 Tax=unclassified Haloarchaeobius TaxID=2614452 RepID=UPI003EC09D1B